MKYFTLNNSTEIQEIGAYPQIEKSENYDYATTNCFWNVKWDQIPDFTPSYEAKLSEGAIATNLLEKLPGFYGLCIDQKLKCLIEGMNLPSHNFFGIDIFQDNTPLDYYWFHFTQSLIPFVDFKNTVFEIFRKNQFSVIKEFSVLSIDELMEQKNQLNFEKGIKVKCIKLKSDFPMYDIISLWGITPIILISERLKLSMENHSITGFETSHFERLEYSYGGF